MKRVTFGSAAPGDITAGFTEIASVEPPPYGDACFLLTVHFTGLNAGHTLVFMENDDGSEPIATGQSSTRVERTLVQAGIAATPISVTVKDTSGLSTSGVAWTYEVWRIDDASRSQPRYLVPRDTTTIPLLFRMSGPGTVPTVTLSKNGAAFAAAAGTVTAVGSGMFKLTPTSADTGTEGPLMLRATGGTSPYTETQDSSYLIYSDAGPVLESEIIAGLGPALAELDLPTTTPAGPGSVQWQVKFQDENANPLDNVTAWVSTDAAGAHPIAGTLASSMNGFALFLLDPGDYYLWATHAGRMHIAGQAFTVTA